MVDAAAASPIEALRQAVARFGSQSEMARRLGIGQAAISKWLAKHRPLPAEHVLKVESATGISRHALRPDLYPIDESPAGRTVGAGRPASDWNRPPKSQVGEPAR